MSPQSPLKPCRHPGCPNLIRKGGYCDRHRKDSWKDGRPTATERGYDHQWRIVRAQYIKHHPICEYCNTRPTAEVHHLVKVRLGGTHAWDNLKAACRSCHKLHEGKG